MPSTVIMIFNFVWFPHGLIGPFKPDPAFVQHVYEMNRVFHGKNITYLIKNVIFIMLPDVNGTGRYAERKR